MASTDATAIPIKNQAYRVTFPIWDADGDLVTGAAGLDSEVSKDGGTFTDCTNEATEIATSSGIYYLDLSATEMNADTVAVIVKTSTSGAKTTALVFYPAEADDIIVNVKQINGTTQTARDVGASVLLAADQAVNMTKIAGVTVSTSTAQLGVNVVNAGGTAWGSGAITAASIANGAIDNATFAADVGSTAYATNIIALAADKAIQNAALATAAELAKVPKSDGSASWNATALAAINAEVDTALNTAIPGSPTANSINERVATMDGLILGTIAAGTHNPQSGDAYAIVNNGTYGNNALKTLIDTVDNFVDTEVAAIKTVTDKLDTALELDVAVYRFTTNALEQAPTGGSAPTAADIADAVWDEALSGHTGAGSAGEALDAAGTAGDPWLTALPGAYGAGTAGKIIGDNLNAPVATVDTVVDGIVTELAKVPKSDSTVTWNSTALASIQAECTDALNAYDPPTKAEMDSAFSTTNGKIDTIDDFLDTEVAAILADTNELQTDLANGGRLDLLIDAIKAKTDNLPASPAAVGSEMTLANDAITSAKFDESTAFPLKYADTGATQVMRTGTEGATSQEVMTQLVAIQGYVDTEVAAIKAKTDSLTFTVAGDLDVNVQSWKGSAAPDMTGDAYAVVSDAEIGCVGIATEVASIGTKVDKIPKSDGSVTWNSTALGSIQSECTDALNAYDPPTKAEMDAAVGGTLTVSEIADAVWDEALSGHSSAGTAGKALADAGAASGAGAVTWVYTALSSIDGITPIDSVRIWVTSDSAGTNVLASGITNAFGQATFYLDPGTVYVWRQKNGYNFINPDTETVS